MQELQNSILGLIEGLMEDWLQISPLVKYRQTQTQNQTKPLFSRNLMLDFSCLNPIYNSVDWPFFPVTSRFSQPLNQSLKDGACLIVKVVRVDLTRGRVDETSTGIIPTSFVLDLITRNLVYVSDSQFRF